MTHPAIRETFQSVARHPAFQELVRRVASGSGASISGLTTTAKALYLVLLWRATEKPLLVIVDGSKQAETLHELVETFLDILVLGKETSRTLLVPSLDVLPWQRMSPHSEISEQRAVALWRLSSSRSPVTIVPAGAALLRLAQPDFYRQLAITLRMEDELPLEEIVAHLEKIGYEKRDPVELVGEYSMRGGILDVFPAEQAKPVRMEFFGDFLESMRRFDVDTQRSVLKLQDVTILPLLETPRSRPELARLLELSGRDGVPSEAFPGWEFLVPLVSPRESNMLEIASDAVVVWDEFEQVKGAAERLWKRLEEPGHESPCPPDKIYMRWEELIEAAGGRNQVNIRELDLSPGADALTIPSRPSMAFHGNMPVAVGETRNFVEAGGRVVFFAPSLGEVERLADILREYSVPYQLGVAPQDATPDYLAERSYVAGATVSTFLVKGRVRRGVVLPDASLYVFGSDDLFDTPDSVAAAGPGKARMGAFQADIGDLKPGDHVVHAIHGIGRFHGIREIAQGDQAGDFMLLEYADAAKLYVPLTRLDLVEKFRGAGETAPPLDKLGGVSWTRTKSRVRARMREMADELLKLYAERRMAEGFAFSVDSNWQREFEDAFEFAATRDQLTAVQEIKRDMESPQPMDRLLCGDVGYGKTEVAMRAAFKALGDGRQVAVLAPTTVLCLQHFETFKRRFAPFPVRVEMLSRFRSNKEIKAALEDIADGKVDITLGTHRLLSKDVIFRDLGLLIVDEEQRFGVRHKERLKQLRKNVDVLTMSATPIPRTLHMSLLGLRDMSVIETPPKDRLSIQTLVAHFDREMVKAAIEQELSRGGQVYFVHNRIETIWERAALIQELVPQARIVVGHGQMGEDALEKVLLGFMGHEYDVFVCTTIVENGLDIPLANTMIIDHAERYGLSELYQLRGRVGRSNRRAYAYLLVPSNIELSEIARKRLAALKEFSDLGAGFKIAALDLELRGAGNLLGGEQHGHIGTVGFDTYVRLLEQTIAELRGVETVPEVHSTISLGLDIRIPPEYIADEHQRLRAYKRVAEVNDTEAADRVVADLVDRYGPVPEAVHTLIGFALIKGIAQRLAAESIDRRQGYINIKFLKESKIDPAKLMALVESNPGTQFTPAGVLRLPLAAQAPPAEVLEFLRSRLLQLQP